MVPYAYLGQINFDNLITSLLLLPLAPLGVYLGAYLTERVGQNFLFYYSFCLILTGTKLIYDGLTLGPCKYKLSVNVNSALALGWVIIRHN